jgi:hypothetical protein
MRAFALLDFQPAVAARWRQFTPSRGPLAPKIGIRFVKQESWRALCSYVLEGRLRAYLVDREDETYEAERSQFAGLAGRSPEVLILPVLDNFSFRDSHGRKLLGGQLFFYEDDLQAVLRAESAKKATQELEASKRRGGVEARIVTKALPERGSIAKVRSPAGRKPLADWDALEAALELRIDESGLPTPDHEGKKWRCRADVIRWAEDFLEDRKESVAQTTVAGRIDEMLRRLKSGK